MPNNYEPSTVAIKYPVSVSGSAFLFALRQRQRLSLQSTDISVEMTHSAHRQVRGMNARPPHLA